MKRYLRACLLSALVAVLFWLMSLNVQPVLAATLPSGFADTLIANGLAYPTTMVFAPDGRLFVSEQCGKLRVVKNDALLSTPFFSISTYCVNERGLFGVAFDPDFATNKYIYAYYTTSTSPIHNRVSRFTANGDVAAAGSETVIIDLDDQTSGPNHNSGALHFGPDGKLYITVGDNGTPTNSQTLANVRGKVLRLNKDGTIPTDNPFYSTATGKNRAIWALGLRNPYTMAFQPGTGRLFINDVGLSTFEEIDDGARGSNYGWPTCEGPCNPPQPNFVDPLYYYPHDTACAIAGGTFYNPRVTQFPSSYVGKYFFSDWCAGWIKYIDPSTRSVTTFLTGGASLVDVRVSPTGSLYYLSQGSGELYKVTYSQNQPPSIVQQPANKTVAAGQTATFSVSAAGTLPLTYQWQKNQSDIAGATGASYTTPPVTSADNGAQFRCIVKNAYGTATSNSATLTLTSNTAPTATINTPADGTKYKGGDVINYAGSASDKEDGTLPASAYTWEVRFEHHPESSPDHHFHQVIFPTTGSTSGSFTIPTTGETATDVWYRIILTVKDSGGLTFTTFRDVYPILTNITVSSSPAGLQVLLDGTPATAPTTVPSVVNVKRQLGVTSPQTLNGSSYVFDHWSDGGAITHDVYPPAANTTYAATFRQAQPARNVQDTFSRTVVDNWGQADSGGGYGLEGTPANFDVNGGAGIMYLGIGNTKRAAYLPGVSLQNLDLRFRVKRDKPAAGGSQIGYWIARRVSYGNEYLGRIRYANDGTIRLQAEALVNSTSTRLGTEQLISTVNGAANTFVWVRGQVTGTNPTTIKLKAWMDGSPEPANWQYSVTDSTPSLQKAGGVGLQSYIANNVTNAPVRFYFDDWSAATLP